jgi:hypothetical protein
MADTPQVTLEKMQLLNKRLTDHEVGIKKAYESARTDLKKGIDDEDEGEIQLAMPDFDKAIEKLDQGLDACDRLHVLTTELFKHPEFVAGHKQTAKEIITHVGTAKKRLGDWAVEARSLRKTSEQALKNAKQGTREVETELAGLKNRGSKLADVIRDCAIGFPKLEKEARDATMADDDKKAERARLAIFDLMKEPKAMLQQLRPLLKTFQDEHKDLERPLKADLQDVVDTVEDADDTLERGDKLFVTLIKLKQQEAADRAQRPKADIPKAELQKVAPIVGIDPKNDGALKKLGDVLNDTPHEKWADGLARLVGSLKLKGPNGNNGKAMVLAIDKLPFFKKQSAQAH